MRIITGAAKGRRLRAPDTPGTRPVTDRAREAVFAMLGKAVVDARVLDLYAGSGSFGLEALSRGASEATFVEVSRQALTVLRKNVDDVGLGGVVVSSTVEAFLNAADDTFDMVFMDPPWALGSEVMEAEMASLERLLSEGADIVVSRRHTDPSPQPPKTWRVATDRRYGDTRILRYERMAE